ncbi:MAG: DNA-directed RNA polymerase subunit beta [Candidatus Marinimicrobia bacterium]|nr:DNA-directed RNA polymerase subunit beta [Candidatus Neomarinimicrobiota bacterium]
MPNLLDIQLESYEEFLQMKVTPENRESKGLQAVFETIFPIEDSRGNYKLEYVNYFLGLPKYTIEECQDRGMSYAVPLKANLRLSVSSEEETGKIEEVIEQGVFFGNVPYMTESGTFIINGAERVIVSQLHRSPGVFFDESIHPNGTRLYSARIIPFRGSWVDFTTDINDALFALIDRRKKFPVTTLLRAIGYSTNVDILELFGMVQEVKLSSKTISKEYDRRLAEDIVNKDTGEILAETGATLDKDLVAILKKEKIKSVNLVSPSDEKDAEVIMNTLAKDTSNDEESALRLIYKQLRSGEPPNLETARKFVDRLFFSPAKYDLGSVGRYRINKRFDLDIPYDTTVLTREDIVAILKHLLKVKKGDEATDDIDHLGNRRIKTVGEQLGNQFSIAFARTARTIRERMNVTDAESLTPSELINSRIITSVINTFFGTSQLSQFMDQTNPLSELTHKRRLSALGPGGLTRERAGFEVRDIHYTHYGRLCPIETPEGPNIGLISSLCTFARINTLGFIETPYRVISHNGKSKVTDKINYLTADDEDKNLIAQASAPLDKNNHFVDNTTRVRLKSDYPVVPVKDVSFMDVSPYQIVSAAAALIPFLEHDDANRALMGSNMQRQAVPLLRPSTPIVGTGMERIVAMDSRAIVLSDVNGTVERVTAQKITIRTPISKSEDLHKLDDDGMKEFNLTKFLRTNQDTCINQKPLVKVGDKIKKGDIIADGAATDRGELALGQNILVAFMPWHGYNYEDAIVVSERLARDDVFSSLHIEEYELQVRDTKRGEEELTREIPNVSEEATRNLDESGVIRVGAEVEPGDILVGKVTPKGETDPTPEEKLLKAIFGEKAGDVKDASLKASPGVYGVVVDTKVFTRRSKDFRKEEKQKSIKLKASYKRRLKWLEQLRNEKLVLILEGLKCSGLKDKETGKSILKTGLEYTKDRIETTDFSLASRENPWTSDDKANETTFLLMDNYEGRVAEINGDLERELFKLKAGDDLPPGIIQLVKVYITSKRKISVGDKMAGRHGNKGVVAEIVPIEDMPFLADGTPVDMILNPLGVPSRMNLGQIYETLLGYAGYKLGVHYETPVFDGATVEEVLEELTKAGIAEDGKTVLYDGITGDKFDQRVTVGKIYMLKLSHLVDDKMHSRSTGPYSLITQQPLGGKAQFGGQRFGEMEVWALQAYGAAYTLQEMLTVKSDDVEGRSKAYEALVKGQNLPKPGIPESFNVLLRELMGLGIDVELK